MPGTKVVWFILLLSTLCGCRNQPELARTPETSVERNVIRHATVIYPYSVVPGGVANARDLQDAMTSDAATATHYRDVNVAALQPVRLPADTLAYVSYRKNGRIYWTRRPVHLAAGEAVLSNGRNCVRGRCGNRISLTPRAPVIDEAGREPAVEVFSTPSVNGLSIDEIAPPLVMTMFSVPSLALPPVASGYPPYTLPSVSPATSIVPKTGPDTWPAGPAPAAIPAAGAMPAILPPAPPPLPVIAMPATVIAAVDVPVVPGPPLLFVLPASGQPSPPKPYSGFVPAVSPSVASSALPPPNTVTFSSIVWIPATISGSTPPPPALPPPPESTPPGYSPPSPGVPTCCTTASQPHPPADATPEPASLLLLAAGLAGLGLVRAAGGRPLIAIMIRYEQAARLLRFDARRSDARARGARSPI